MRPQISRILLVAAIAGLVLTSPAGARPVFDGKVCGLLTAKQIATVPGLSPACRNARPTKGLGSTMYVGNWPGKTPTSPILQVTIARYTDSGALQLAKHNLRQGLPGGPPRKVPGVGAGAYEANGASSVGIHFTVGGYVGYVSLNTRGTASRALEAALETLAKAVAARL